EYRTILLEIQFTKEAKKILDMPADIQIEFVTNISRIQNSASVSYLSEEELVDIAKTMRSSRLVNIFLNDNGEILLKGLAFCLVSNKELEDKIFSTFDDELQIRKDATPELKRLFTALKDTEKNIKNKVSELLSS